MFKNVHEYLKQNTDLRKLPQTSKPFQGNGAAMERSNFRGKMERAAEHVFNSPEIFGTKLIYKMDIYPDVDENEDNLVISERHPKTLGTARSDKYTVR